MKSIKVDISDPEQVKTRKTKAQLRRERELAELKELLQTRTMRNFVWRLLGYSKLYEGPVSHEIDGWRQIGMSDVARWVLHEILEAEPNVYTLMRNEDQERS